MPGARDPPGRQVRAARRPLDINSFLRAVLFNFLLGNSDAHGKNFALLHDPQAGTRLAPLYHVVSTGVYGELTDRMAMTIGGEADPAAVDLEAWRRLGVEAGLDGQLTGLVRKWAIDALVGVQEAHMAAREEGWHRPVVDRIAELCWGRCAQLGVD